MSVQCETMERPLALETRSASREGRAVVVYGADCLFQDWQSDLERRNPDPYCSTVELGAWSGS